MNPMTAPASGVRVRMYNPGFGDCFLLAFAGENGKPVYVMIDCGVHGSYRGGSDRIRAVLRDVRAATGNRLDLVVVTHEHADHVSGFYLGRKIFDGVEGEDEKGIEVAEAWFGWTEEPGNEKAERLDKAKKLMLQGLVGAHQSLAASEAEKLESMLGFYASEPDAAEVAELAGSPGAVLPLGKRGRRSIFGVSTRKSRDRIREHAAHAEYLKPKRKPRPIPGVGGVRVFVLGPPEDEKALLAPDPTGAAGEVYEEEGGHHLRLEADKALVAAMAAAGKLPAGLGGSAVTDDFRPFAGNHAVDYEIARARKDLHKFFHRRYGFGHSHKEAWRRIDDDWLNPAESLALKLDSATNNTSLVLAIELPKSRRVLLFPGDAQVGNWLSWHEGGWSEDNGLQPGEAPIDAKDLLERTVLYKVGHHGSHNATLQDRGLKLMTSDELIALIPVDQDWALARRPHAWNMPFPPMYEDLLHRTRGRILRTDHGIVPGADEAWARFPGKAPKAVRGDDGEWLYTELDIPDG